MIYQTFRNINRLLILSFKNGDNDPTRNFFVKYYMLLVKIKDCNTLIDKRTCFDEPVKNKQEAYENLSKLYNREHIRLFATSKLL